MTPEEWMAIYRNEIVPRQRLRAWVRGQTFDTQILVFEAIVETLVDDDAVLPLLSALEAEQTRRDDAMAVVAGELCGAIAALAGEPT